VKRIRPHVFCVRRGWRREEGASADGGRRPDAGWNPQRRRDSGGAVGLMRKFGPVAGAGRRPYAVNRYIVCVRYVSPGVKTVVGNAGWLGESGKCWVSRHSPPCLG
jgi:hypothetical protein